jgi:hypothetical protein
MIEDCCCDYESVDSVNGEVLHPLLQELVTTPFFRYFKVRIFCFCVILGSCTFSFIVIVSVSWWNIFAHGTEMMKIMAFAAILTRPEQIILSCGGQVSMQ